MRASNLPPELPTTWFEARTLAPPAPATAPRSRQSREDVLTTGLLSGVSDASFSPFTGTHKAVQSLR